MATTGIAYYSEKDAEFDTKLYFTEETDVNNYSIINSNNTELEEHFKNLRYLRTASSILESELNNRKRRDSWEFVERIPASITNISAHYTNSLTSPSNNNDPINDFTSHSSLGDSALLVDPINKSPRLETTTTDYSSLFPRKILLNEIHHPTADNRTNEQKLKQLKKDIERDKLLINNQRLLGAICGLDGIIAEISKILEHLMIDTTFPSLNTTLKEKLIYSILFKSSRTHSGALVFHALQSLIDTNTMLLIPQSSIAPPIHINLSIGDISSQLTQNERHSKDYGTTTEPITSHHKRKNPDALEEEDADSDATNDYCFTSSWGIICKVSCEFIYTIIKRDILEGELMKEQQHPQQQESVSGNSNKSNKSEKDSEEENKLHSLLNSTVSVIFEDYVNYPINLSEIGNYNNNPHQSSDEFEFGEDNENGHITIQLIK